MALVIRNQEPGDGDGLARVWQSAGRYYTELAPDLFQVPVSDSPSFEAGSVPRNALRLVAEADGTIAGWLADGPVAVPFYEQRMGYHRRAIIFEKRL